ncbi:MAG: hypothetical protein AB7Q69_17685 [Gemmatimonadales bacterium]
MNLTAAHIHLMLNHIPVLGAPFLLLLLGIGLVHRSADIQRVALMLTVLLSLATIPAYLTGEPAEHQVRDATWFTETDKEIAHEHEERAEVSFIVMLATGVIALGVLWLSRGKEMIPRHYAWIALLALLVTSGLMAWTALEGGEIRHEEVR